MVSGCVSAKHPAFKFDAFEIGVKLESERVIVIATIFTGTSLRYDVGIRKLSSFESEPSVKSYFFVCIRAFYHHSARYPLSEKWIDFKYSFYLFLSI
jgi:hypothetical protein